MRCERALLVDGEARDVSYSVKEYSQAIIKHHCLLLVLENTLSATKRLRGTRRSLSLQPELEWFVQWLYSLWLPRARYYSSSAL